MEERGYSTTLPHMQPSTSLRVAPPLGHTPPPPPLRPPPFTHISPFPLTPAQLAAYAQYYNSYQYLETYSSIYSQTNDNPDILTEQGDGLLPTPTDINYVAALSKWNESVYGITGSAGNCETSQSSLTSQLSDDIVTSTTFSGNDGNIEDREDASKDELQKGKEPSCISTVTQDEERSDFDDSKNDISFEGHYKSDETLKMKFSGGFQAKKRSSGQISVQLKPQNISMKKPKCETKKKTITVAQAFGSDSEDEEEQMPKAAKLRMRNIGKDTPTSSGPNSYNKTSKGFTDTAALFKKQFNL